MINLNLPPRRPEERQPLRLAFNATALLSTRTGLGQYTLELATRLRDEAALETEFFYGLGWSAEVRAEALPGAGTLLPALRRWIPGSYAIRQFLQSRRFTTGMRGKNFDLYHEPNFLPLPFEGPTVTTVHDLSWLWYPEAHPAERVRAMNRRFEAGLDRSHLLITDSAFVRQEVIDTFGVAPERVVSISLGASREFRPMEPEETTPTLARLGLSHGGYLLAVGTLEPRKNLVSAIRAYAGLSLSVRQRTPLVIAGMRGWHTQALERELAPLVASGQVHVTGYLPRPDLIRLVAGARAMVYPSLYEGFGLPPLESMACGVPVIVSDAGSLMEVVADAGRIVGALDTKALRDAMQNLVEDDALRSRLGQRALARSFGFSWDKCATETLAAYRRAIQLAG